MICFVVINAMTALWLCRCDARQVFDLPKAPLIQPVSDLVRGSETLQIGMAATGKSETLPRI